MKLYNSLIFTFIIYFNNFYEVSCVSKALRTNLQIHSTIYQPSEYKFLNHEYKFVSELNNDDNFKFDFVDAINSMNLENLEEFDNVQLENLLESGYVNSDNTKLNDLEKTEENLENLENVMLEDEIYLEMLKELNFLLDIVNLGSNC